MRSSLYLLLFVLSSLVAVPSAEAQYEIYLELQPEIQFETALQDDYPLRLPVGLAIGQLDSFVIKASGFRNTITIEREAGRTSLYYREGLPRGVDYYFIRMNCPTNAPSDGRDTCFSTAGDFPEPGSGGAVYFDSNLVVRHFSAGKLDSQYVDITYVTQSATDTSYDSFFGKVIMGYDAAGRRVSKERYALVGTDTVTAILAEITSLTYDSEGRLIRQDQLDDFTFPDPSGYVMEYTYSGDRVNYLIDYQDLYTERGVITTRAGELDSLTYIAADDDDEYEVVFVRTDDGRNPTVRRYLVTGDAIATLEYYYAEPISSAVAEAPVVPGHLIAANPLAAGAAVRLEGLPAGAHLELVDAQGRLVAREVVADGAAAFAWPVLPQGVYLVVARAEGHQARAWRIVQQ